MCLLFPLSRDIFSLSPPPPPTNFFGSRSANFRLLSGQHNVICVYVGVGEGAGSPVGARQRGGYPGSCYGRGACRGGQPFIPREFGPCRCSADQRRRRDLGLHFRARCWRAGIHEGDDANWVGAGNGGCSGAIRLASDSENDFIGAGCRRFWSKELASAVLAPFQPAAPG